CRCGGSRQDLPSFPTRRSSDLDAWRETKLFTQKERAVLALTEAMTLIAGKPVPNDIYNQAKAHLTDKELAAVIMAVVAINGWNRSEEHTSELQSRENLVCRLLL